MFERVLVPLDGSELAERALPAALSLIPDGDGEIILLRIPVVTPMSHSKPTGALSWWYPEQALQRATEEARAYLSAICARHARPGARIVMKVIEGDPAAEIVDVAKARKVDAIVMTTHGYSGVTHWVMGSVTEKVVRNAACPVMIVRAKRPIKQILVPVDGSEHAERALNVALELALQTEASITLLQVIEPTFILEPGILGWEHVSLERDDLALAAAEKNAAGYLSHLMERHAGRGVALSTAVRIGPIAATILQAAKEASTDVIVMATHGRTGLRRWVYGSVTEKVLRRASCGLLIVRIPAHLLREKAEQARSPEGLSFARSLPENEMESKK